MVQHYSYFVLILFIIKLILCNENIKNGELNDKEYSLFASNDPNLGNQVNQRIILTKKNMYSSNTNSFGPEQNSMRFSKLKSKTPTTPHYPFTFGDYAQWNPLTDQESVFNQPFMIPPPREPPVKEEHMPGVPETGYDVDVDDQKAFANRHLYGYSPPEYNPDNISPNPNSDSNPKYFDSSDGYDIVATPNKHQQDEMTLWTEKMERDRLENNSDMDLFGMIKFIELKSNIEHFKNDNKKYYYKPWHGINQKLKKRHRSFERLRGNGIYLQTNEYLIPPPNPNADLIRPPSISGAYQRSLELEMARKGMVPNPTPIQYYPPPQLFLNPMPKEMRRHESYKWHNPDDEGSQEFYNPYPSPFLNQYDNINPKKGPQLPGELDLNLGQPVYYDPQGRDDGAIQNPNYLHNSLPDEHID